MTEEQKNFYENLTMGNAINQQQAHNNIILAVTSKLTEAIMSGEDTEKIKELIDVLKNVKEEL